MRHAMTGLGWGILGLALIACAGQPGSIELSGSTSTPRAGPSARPSASDASAPSLLPQGLCPSAFAESGTRPVLLANLDSKPVLFRADGSQQELLPDDDVGASAGATLYQDGGYFALFRETAPRIGEGGAGTTRVFQAVVFDRDGVLASRYRRPLGELGTVFTFAADGYGGFALGAVLTPSLVHLPDGQEREFDNLWALAAADTGGWLPASVNDRAGHYVFANAKTGEVRPVAPGGRSDLLMIGDPQVIAGRLVNLAMDEAAGEVFLIEASPDRAQLIPISLVADGPSLQRSADSVYVTARGVPIASWHAQTGVVRYPVMLPPEGERAESRVSNGFAVIARNGLPTEILDVQAGTIRPVRLPATPLLAADSINSVSFNGRFFLGTAGDWTTNAVDVPVWRVDTETGEAIAVDIGKVAPLHPFDGALYCADSPSVGDDGRVALGLRDDRVGGVFAWDPQEGKATQIGMPLTQVMVATHYRFGQSFWVSGETLEHTYCPSAGPEGMAALWPEAPGVKTLDGDSTQIISKDGLITVLPEGTQIGNVDPSGACAFDQQGNIYDFNTGSVWPLGSAAQGAQWLKPP